MASNKLACPKCGGQTKRDGTRNGVQRYACKNQRTCKWEGERAAQSDPNANAGVSRVISRANAADMRRPSAGVKTYLVTAAQNATDIHEGFYGAIQSFMAHRDAELSIVPVRYHNPTSLWSEAAKSSDWWHEAVIPHMMAERVNLGDHMMVLGDIKTQPTRVRPLEGYESISGARSAILAHPHLQLKSVPTPQQRLPKLLTTTGAITVPNYTPTDRGKKGEFHHTLGAALVEVTPSGGFHLRQINALRDGSFCDLGYEYRAGVPPRAVSALALAMGDTHVKFLDPAVERATWGPGGMIDVLQPEVLVWHDVYDGYSHKHWTRGQLMTEIARQRLGTGDIRAEIEECAHFIADRARQVKLNVFVESNHPRWLLRWLNEINPRYDVQNAVFWAETLAMVQGSLRMGDGGMEHDDPFVKWMHRLLPAGVRERCKFLASDESFTVKGIELGMHGDRGANGAKGSLSTFAKIGVKSITGDAHSPGIEDGAYRVGTSSRLRLEYTRGPSSWLQTHAVVYCNGKRSLLNIIDGNWKG
jgi:hypothetical protein